MLSAILSALAGIALLLLAILVVVLCTPLHMVASFNSTREPALDVKLALLGGLVPLPNIQPANQYNHVKKQRSKRKSKSGKPKIKNRFMCGVNIRAALKATPRFLSRVLHTIKIELLDAHLGYGFKDPADTGMAYGMLSPLVFWIDSSEKLALSIEPDFGQARFDGKGRVSARFTPVTLFPPMIGFGWSAFAAPKLSRAFR